MAKYEKMGKAIKAAMITNGLQHKDLLSIFIEKKGSPITRGALSHWISGTIKPSEEHLDILCDILNLNPHELFDTEEQIELIYKVTTRAPWYNDAIQLVKDIENCKKSSIYRTIPVDIQSEFKRGQCKVLNTTLSVFGGMRDATLYIDSSIREPGAGLYLISIGDLCDVRELRVNPLSSTPIIYDLNGDGGTEEYIVTHELPLTVLGKVKYMTTKV
ncbi:helix-turn-helix domain-containing protein [Acinetobacter lwoffii]|uniref:helix-turn-helix domain-containing protein n=1 Tax=Acinetobacter lwoffii TaxID=28090 RepID=UPI00209AD39C|nr:helix-turn-helix transcriptional regulator [Acinetobacter lwoffii]MCO8073033.1 helix-turn-helix domain-containing protein [Acinetobacter lwoffii]MCO8076153.1 helix-turn-helix domain-containing protein [Acinetobacter lwoffii]